MHFFCCKDSLEGLYCIFSLEGSLLHIPRSNSIVLRIGLWQIGGYLTYHGRLNEDLGGRHVYDGNQEPELVCPLSFTSSASLHLCKQLLSPLSI